MIEEQLRMLADRYETAKFLDGDPSWFMHQVEDDCSRETLAFVAASLSYGSRKQFLPKIQYLLDSSIKRKVTFYEWVKRGLFAEDVPDDSGRCFYRLYSFHTMHTMLNVLKEMLVEYGTIKNYLLVSAQCGKMPALEAVQLIVDYCASRGIEGIIPKNTKSSCKRICMFLRWMVRDNSPVDLGLWSDIIDKKTLIMPMDTHVVQEANRLGLMQSKATSMSSAVKLTERLRKIFPEDPLKGDFALFGLGVGEV